MCRYEKEKHAGFGEGLLPGLGVCSCCQLRSYSIVSVTRVGSLILFASQGNLPQNLSHTFLESFVGRVGEDGGGRRMEEGRVCVYSQLPLSLDKTHKSHTHAQTHTHAQVVLCHEAMGSCIWPGASSLLSP